MADLTNPTNIVTVERLDYFKGKLAGEQSYQDVYVGVGATYSVVMVAANHHDSIAKQSLIPITAGSTYLWVILPDTYSPIVRMNGIDVPMARQSDVTQDEITYKVLRSSNQYSGSFSITLT